MGCNASKTAPQAAFDPETMKLHLKTANTLLEKLLYRRCTMHAAGAESLKAAKERRARHRFTAATRDSHLLRRARCAGQDDGASVQGGGLGASVCTLTASTGLSLAESVARAGQRDGVDTSALVGDATAFFSYSWTGTKLGDMLDAVERGIKRLEAERGGKGRVLVWIDMFCASQNLLGGVYRDDANHPKGSPGYKARKEDTDHIFDDALDAVSVVIFYLSPLEGEWKAPPHAYLADDRGEPGCRVDSPRPKRRHARVVPL